MKHLEKERKLTVEKVSPGVYYINKETFHTQIIVAKELPPEENLYLRCLTDNLEDAKLANRLTNDYEKHQDQDIYIRYMRQLATANLKTKGDLPMVCEGLLDICNMISDEIIERTKKEADEYYLPKIDQLSSQNNDLSSQIVYLQSLLVKNGIPFDADGIHN